MISELRIALRALRRTPGVAISAVFCLAGAIGVATATFAIVNGVVLRPLPFHYAPRLVAIWGVNPARDTVRRGFSWPDTIDVARATRSLDGVAAMANAPGGMTLTGRGEPLQIPTRIVSGRFFDVLGVPAALGRTLSADDDVPGSQPTVVISDALWRDRFDADPAIAGRSIALDGRGFVVAGVAPRGFAYPPDAQMWVTATHGAPDDAPNRNIGWLEIIGRMRPDVAPATVHDDLAVVLRDLAARYHPSRGPEEISITPLQQELLGDSRLALWALLAAVLVLLATACANVGGLLLVRSAARAHELAIRLALGAARVHLMRQSIAESVVLLGAGSIGAVALSFALVGAVRRAAPGNIPGIAAVAIDWRVLAFALVVTSAATAICAIAPALLAASRDARPALQGSGRTVTHDGGAIARALAGCEMALAVILMAAAMLVTRTFLNLRGIDVGFNTDRVLAFDVPQPANRYPDAKASLQFADRLLAQIATLPGVRRASSVLIRPLWSVAGMDWPVTIEGQPPADAAQNPLTNLEAISAGYFETLEIPLLEGRAITDRDREGQPGAAVVSRSFAKRFWSDGHALGRRLKFPLPGSPYSGQWFTVVGVVGDARYRELRRSRLDLYINAAQCPYPVHQFVVRTAGPPDAIVGAIRREVRAIDPALPLDDVVVLREAVQQQLANPRVTAATFAAFAAAATALAALGLGTLVAWRVRQRTRELGIRLALGATPRQVMTLVLSDSAGVVGGGVAIGIAGALALERFLQTLLFEVPAHDPIDLAGVGALALIVGLLSAYLPARRATRVDPLAALHDASA